MGASAPFSPPEENLLGGHFLPVTDTAGATRFGFLAQKVLSCRSSEICYRSVQKKCRMVAFAEVRPPPTNVRNRFVKSLRRSRTDPELPDDVFRKDLGLPIIRLSFP